MGKRIFEVAKELGLDHRELITKCDTLKIRVRNYMSVLTDADEARLKSSFDGATGGTGVVEAVQAPGVVRRRRAKTVDKPAVRRVVVPQPSIPTPEPEPEEQPQPAAVEEVEASAEASEVETPAAEEVSSEASPVVEQAAEVAESEEAAPASAQEVEPAQPEEAKKPPADVPSEPAIKPRAAVPPKGGAKVLGSIPIEQLRQRTARPKRAPSQGRSGGQGASGGRPGARPAGGPPRGGAGGQVPQTGNPAFGVNLPPKTGQDGLRRRRPGAAPREGERSEAQKKGATRRRQVFSREDIYRGAAGRSGRGRKRKSSSKKGMKTVLTTPAAHKRVVNVDETISVGELGKAMGVKGAELIGKLIQMGSMVTINEQLDMDTATLLATDYEYEVKNVAFDEETVLSGPVVSSDEEVVEEEGLIVRAPVVTVMGHVDHGKTTLLDQIRSANVADGEAGGITQHTAAYKVTVPTGGEVVFLDTPGHEAFTAMRARGASVTDIVVLIVAADDGIMPQTIESISHAKAAGVPIVVAVNKMDKPDSDPERVKQELTTYELVPEEWGGETIVVPVSALNGDGVPELLESLALLSEVLELKANPDNEAFGRVVEARMQKGRGTVCTVLVQEGTLKKGDYIVCGSNYGRVRAMMNDLGETMTEAGPSTPVEVIGLGGIPSAGDGFHVVKNERDAKRVVAAREDKARAAIAKPKVQDPMELLAAFGQPDKEVQNVILKTDVSGSYEAIKAALEQLATDEVEVKILHGGVGTITESDVDLALASDAAILSFNAEFESKAKRAAERSELMVLRYSVIYEMLDAVKDLMSGLLSPETVEEFLGKVEVRAVFHIQKVGTVAGSFVLDGKVLRNAHAKIIRDDEILHEGKITTLKRFKDDVKEVAHGFECGICVEGYKDVAEGDIIDVYEVKQIQRSIDD